MGQGSYPYVYWYADLPGTNLTLGAVLEFVQEPDGLFPETFEVYINRMNRTLVQKPLGFSASAVEGEGKEAMLKYANDFWRTYSKRVEQKAHELAEDYIPPHARRAA